MYQIVEWAELDDQTLAQLESSENRSILNQASENFGRTTDELSACFVEAVRWLMSLCSQGNRALGEVIIHAHDLHQSGESTEALRVLDDFANNYPSATHAGLARIEKENLANSNQ